MEQITRKAYAKINLVLDVTGRLPNGYHEVSMVMQNVGIHDTLTFTKRGDEQIVLTTNDGQLPLGEDNLIYKAVDGKQRRCDNSFRKKDPCGSRHGRRQYRCSSHTPGGK